MKTCGWSWGLPELDRLIGPLTPGRLYVIGARPSCGKTAYAMNLVSRIIEAVLEKRVDGEHQPWKILAWFTERSREAAIKSLAALQMGYDEDAVLRADWRNLPGDAEDKVGDRVAELSELWPAFICGDRTLPTLADLRYDIDHFIDGGDYSDLEDGEEIYRDQPEILFLDYLQMVQPVPGQTQFDGMLKTVQYLRQLAGQGMTVIVCSQLKRRGDGVFDKYRPPHLEDFWGGGLIEATAEIGLGLFRPLKKMTYQDVREVREGRATLKRWAEPGVMAVKCLKHTYIGPAADGLVRARIGDDRRIRPYFDQIAIPINASDAWEPPEESELPF